MDPHQSWKTTRTSSKQLRSTVVCAHIHICTHLRTYRGMPRVKGRQRNFQSAGVLIFSVGFIGLFGSSSADCCCLLTRRVMVKGASQHKQADWPAFTALATTILVSDERSRLRGFNWDFKRNYTEFLAWKMFSEAAPKVSWEQAVRTKLMGQLHVRRSKHMINAINRTLDYIFTFNPGQQIKWETAVLCKQQTSKQGAVTMLLEISKGLQSFPRYPVIPWLSLAPAQLFLQAVPAFPTSPLQLEEAKQYGEIPFLFIHGLGHAVTHLKLSKTFPFFLVVFLLSFFFFTDTNDPSRKNFNWAWPKAGLLYLLPSPNIHQVKSRLKRKRRWGSKSRLEVKKMGHLLDFMFYAR